MTARCAHCCLAALLLTAVGCQSARLPAHVAHGNSLALPQALARAPLASARPPAVAPVNFQESLPGPPLPPVVPSAGQPLEFVGEVLSREELQAAVEAQNPSLEAMLAAWQAATHLYPQRVALDDPLLMGMIAPQSAGSSVTETAYALQLNQKLPWFGKRRWRGAVAEADADAARQEAEDTRLQVRLAADLAFLEYFLVTRLVEINRENTQKLEELRDTAQAQYRANRVTQQDVLQAELELGDQARRQLELVRMRHVAIARINTLLRRWPDAPLPPPPANLASLQPPESTDLLWQTALLQRPDLAALAALATSAEAALELAYKNYRPDFDVFGRYDTFWQPSNTQGPLRAQVGVAVNVPVWREKLAAAVCEAQYRLNQKRAELDQRSREIQYEVVAAAEQVEESRQTVELFTERLLPAAEQNVAAARANYEVNKLSFVELAIAQRQLIALRERQVESLVSYHRRTAELERVIGGRPAAVSAADMPGR